MKHFQMAVSLMVLVFLFCLGFGCGEKGKDYLTTPEKTIETYVSQALTLEKMADPLAYSRVMDCFSKKIQTWWENNANNLLEDPSIVDGFVGSKREAVVFAKYVIPKGPKVKYGPVEPVRISLSGDKASYRLGDTQLNLIKEGKNWRIDSLFGLEK